MPDLTPEQRARAQIDAQLAACGWVVQDYRSVEFSAGRGIVLREVIFTINRMQADGVIQRYSIGGAIGATFYLEPVATLDVDIFVSFRPEPGSLLLSPAPLFDYLRARGATMEGEYILIGGWPVQFRPPTGPLVEEALAQAVESDVDGTPARVFTAEHLAAITHQNRSAE